MYNLYMERIDPFADGETYHLFNRGAHKQAIFIDEQDYARFQTLLFLSNTSSPVVVRDVLNRYKGESFVNLFKNEKRKDPLVEILAYSLMPNHFHLAARQVAENGISRFMRKIGTAYSMYFNLQHQHGGTVFQGPFKSRHIDTDPYLFWIFAYVHLNPVSLADVSWKEREVTDVRAAQSFLNQYTYSSYYDFYTGERPERNLLAYTEAKEYIDTKQDVEDLLRSFKKGAALHPSDL